MTTAKEMAANASVLKHSDEDGAAATPREISLNVVP